MGTKIIGGASRNFNWEDFRRDQSLSSVEIELFGDNQKVELSGSSPNFSASGTFTSGVIDLEGMGSTIDFTKTTNNGTSLTLSVRGTNTAPSINSEARGWGNLQYPSEQDITWGKKFAGLAYMNSSLKVKINCFNRTPKALLNTAYSDTLHLGAIQDDIGQAFYSIGTGSWTTYNSNLKAQMEAASLTAGKCNILQMVGFSFYNSNFGEALVIGESEFGGAQLWKTSISTNWINYTSAFNASGVTLNTSAIITNFIISSNYNYPVVALRTADAMGAIVVRKPASGSWVKVFESEKILYPINFSFHPSDKYVYLSCLYQDEGWKTIIFCGTLRNDTIDSWFEVECDGSLESSGDFNTACCGVGVIYSSGVYKPIMLSSSGVLWDLTFNIPIDNLDELIGGRLAISHDYLEAMAYSVGTSGPTYLLKYPYDVAAKSPDYSYDNITYCGIIVDVLGTTTTTRNWKMAGSPVNTEYADSLLSWTDRISWTAKSSGDAISAYRYYQFKSVLTGA
jgi:hypothetical protein